MITINGASATESNVPVLTGATQGTMTLYNYRITPANDSPTAIHSAVTLGASAQDVSTSINNPDFPRIVTVSGNVSGVGGSVVITGTDASGGAITDSITANGAGEISGTKAFAAVSNIHLPAQTHTPTAQQETATIVGTITGDGNAKITVIALGMNNSSKVVSVAVLSGDSASDVAGKARTALGLDTDVNAFFIIGGSNANVALTSKTKAANDATMNIASTNDTCTGLTPAPTSAHTVAGIGYDTISVGYANVFGFPAIVKDATYVLLHNFYGSNDAGSFSVSTTLSQNLYTLAGTPNGSKVLALVVMLY